MSTKLQDAVELAIAKFNRASGGSSGTTGTVSIGKQVYTIADGGEFTLSGGGIYGGSKKLSYHVAGGASGKGAVLQQQDDLRTFARDLILAVKEIVPKEAPDSKNRSNWNACRAEMLSSINDFLSL